MNKKEYMKKFIEIELNLIDYQNNLKSKYFDLKDNEIEKMIIDIKINEIQIQLNFIKNLKIELNK